MRYRIKDYAISGQDIILPEEITIEDLRLIVNETQKVVICSSMQKDNVEIYQDSYDGDSDGYPTLHTFIQVPTSVCTLSPTDQLTIEVGKGDNVSQITQLLDEYTAQLHDIIGE